MKSCQTYENKARARAGALDKPTDLFGCPEGLTQEEQLEHNSALSVECMIKGFHYKWACIF